MDKINISKSQYDLAKLLLLDINIKYPHECERVSKEIREFAKSQIPDYAGFVNYLHNFSKEAREVPSFDHLINSNSDNFYEVMYLILDYMILNYEAKNDLYQIDMKNPKEALINYNKLKLYFKLEDIYERFITTLLALFDNPNKLEDIPDNFKQLTPPQAKTLLYKALREKNKDLALELIGGINNLDEGEYDYFRALIYFMNNNFQDMEKSLNILNKIEEEHIDYYNSRYLMLKIYGYFGNYDKFKQVSKTIINSIDQYSFKEYVQILLENISIDEMIQNKSLYFDRLKKLINHTKKEPEINKYKLYENTIKLIIKKFELQKEIYNNQHILNKNDNMFKKCKTKLELITKILELTVSEHFNNINNIDGEKLYNYICNNFLKDYHYILNTDELIYKLIQYLLGTNTLVKRVLEQLIYPFIVVLDAQQINNYEDIKNLTFEEQKQIAEEGKKILGNEFKKIFTLTYIEALKEGSEVQIEELNAFGLIYDFINDKQLITNKEILNILNKLSPQGKLAYQSALFLCDKNKLESFGWNDAGSVSLSYYKILEIEYNNKLIKPTISKLNLNQMDKLFNEINSKHHKNRWKKIIDNIKSSSNFELGSLYYFFKFLDEERTPDYKLINYFKDILFLHFNEEGKKAFQEGNINEPISYVNREKYRNPPAHTEYLSFEAAKECINLVDKTIINLSSWVINL